MISHENDFDNARASFIVNKTVKDDGATMHCAVTKVILVLTMTFIAEMVSIMIFQCFYSEYLWNGVRCLTRTIKQSYADIRNDLHSLPSSDRTCQARSRFLRGAKHLANCQKLCTLLAHRDWRREPLIYSLRVGLTNFNTGIDNN